MIIDSYDLYSLYDEKLYNLYRNCYVFGIFNQYRVKIEFSGGYEDLGDFDLLDKLFSAGFLEIIRKNNSKLYNLFFVFYLHYNFLNIILRKDKKIEVVVFSESNKLIKTFCFGKIINYINLNSTFIEEFGAVLRDGSISKIWEYVYNWHINEEISYDLFSNYILGNRMESLFDKRDLIALIRNSYLSFDFLNKINLLIGDNNGLQDS